MTTFAILGPKTSKAVAMLANHLHIDHLTKERIVRVPDVVINYGFKGEKERKFYQKHPNFKDVLTINATPAINKYDAIQNVSIVGVPTIESHHQYNALDNPADYLFKPYYSQKGRGIIPAEDARNNPQGYYQKKITDRQYEVRVTGFKWLSMDQWPIWKKTLGQAADPNQIAWNHDQGGVFERIEGRNLRVFRECLDYTKRVLDTLNYQFGAVDFIVHGRNKTVSFLEVNIRPGFTHEYGADVYYSAFKELVKLDTPAIANLVQQVIVDPLEPPAEPAVPVEQAGPNDNADPLERLWQAAHRNLVQELDRVFVNFQNTFGPAVMPDTDEVARNIMAGTIL